MHTHVQYWGWFLPLILLTVPVAAQNLDGTPLSSYPYYRLVEQPGQATVRVTVLAPNGSGVYEVGVGLTLEEILAISGALGLPVKTRGLERKATVRLYRTQGPDGGGRLLLFDSTPKDMLTRMDYPVLQDMDVVEVEVIEKSKLGWRDVVSLVTASSALVLLIERLGGL